MADDFGESTTQFDIATLTQLTRQQQLRTSKRRPAVHSKVGLVGELENAALTILPVADGVVASHAALPLLQRRRKADPDDLGNSAHASFTSDGQLVRPPIRLPDGPPERTISLGWRLSLTHTMPHPAVATYCASQLSNSVHQERLRYLSQLCVSRARLLREQGCLLFRDTAAYRRHLYCHPTEAVVYGSLAPRCHFTRLCPWCWIAQYITEPFFGLRRLMLDRRQGDMYGRLRGDWKLTVVNQGWHVPQSTHLFDIMSDLQARRGQLYAETPSARRHVHAMVQLQYIEPPISKTAPWVVRRRALLLSDVSQIPYAYPDDGYTLCNQSRDYYQLSQRALVRHLSTAFAYPLALQLSPLNLVRRLLDAQRLWPHDQRAGFRLFSSRGCIRRANRQSLKERSQHDNQETNEDEDEDC